jgi:hypothetical protein
MPDIDISGGDGVIEFANFRSGSFTRLTGYVHSTFPLATIIDSRRLFHA